MKSAVFRRSLLAVVLATAPVFAACSSDGAGPDSLVDGTYDLAEINEKELPATVYSIPVEETTIDFIVKSGRLTLDDGDYSFTLAVDVEQDGALVQSQNLEDTGRFTVNGSAVVFDSDDPEMTETFSGVVNGTTLTLSASDPEFGDYTAVFRR